MESSACRDRILCSLLSRLLLTMLEALVGPVEVGIDDSMPALGGHVRQRAGELASSIVHQIVDAPMCAHSILHEGLNLQSSVGPVHTYTLQCYLSAVLPHDQCYLSAARLCARPEHEHCPPDPNVELPAPPS